MGISNIEVGSIVSEKIIPQMKDGIVVFNKMNKYDKKLNCSMLISNQKGINISMENDVKNIAFFTSPSDKFNLKNINKNVEDSFILIENMKKSINNGAFTKGYLSCINQCPFEGLLSLDKIIKSISFYARN